jgi:hypothetical protein
MCVGTRPRRGRATITLYARVRRLRDRQPRIGAQGTVVSEEAPTASVLAREFVAEPPGQRTRIVVASDEDHEAIGRIPVPVLKTLGAVTGGAAAAGAGAAWWAAAGSTGALIGTPPGWAALAAAGVSYPAYRRWVRPYEPLLRAQRTLDARLVSASVAARLRMPQGPPQTSTLYVVHPRRTP